MALPTPFLFSLTLIIVRRAVGSDGFVVQPRRWAVERSLGWLNRWRRPSQVLRPIQGLRGTTEVPEDMATLAMIRFMVHRLAHPNRKRLPAP